MRKENGQQKDIFFPLRRDIERKAPARIAGMPAEGPIMACGSLVAALLPADK